MSSKTNDGGGVEVDVVYDKPGGVSNQSDEACYTEQTSSLVPMASMEESSEPDIPEVLIS